MKKHSFKIGWILSFSFLIFWFSLVFLSCVQRNLLPLIKGGIAWTELVLLFLLILVSTALGRKILRWLKIEFTSFLEEFLFSLGLGLGTLAYLTFGLGLCGLLYRWAAFTLLGILCLFLTSEIRDILRIIKHQGTQFLAFHLTPPQFLLGVVVSLATLFYFIAALAPPIFYDSLVYHLAVPSLYIQYHKIIYFSFNFFSNFPFGMEMLYTLSLLLKSDILAKLIHFSMGPLIFLAIYSFSQKYWGRKTAFWAGAIFYLVPQVGIISTQTGVDLGLTFFEFLAVWALINWFESSKKNLLILSGIACGLSLAIKYTGIFCFAILLMGVILKGLLEDKEKFPKVMKGVFIFIFVTGLVASPWYIKNFVFTGNPTYPFLFGGRGWDIGRAGKYMHFLRGHGPGHGNIINYLKLPWTLTLYPSRVNGYIGPLYLLLLPLLLCFRKIDRVIKYLLIYGGLYFILWTVSTQQVRFIIPALPLFSIIVAYLLKRLSVQWKRFSQVLIPILLIILLSNLFWFIRIERVIADSLPVVCGLTSRENFLSRGLSYYDTVNYLNHHLPESAKVLFIGEARGYYCQRKFIANAAHDPTVIVKLIHASSSMEELLHNLNRLGITHILYNRREAARLAKQYSYFDWANSRDAQMYEKFMKDYLQPIYTKNEVYLYKVQYIMGE